MQFLDVFALVVLLLLGAAAVAILAVLGMMPGRIARNRNHPQTAAVTACGWWGLITMGILLPVAYIWAYYNPRWQDEHKVEASDEDELS